MTWKKLEEIYLLGILVSSLVIASNQKGNKQLCDFFTIIDVWAEIQQALQSELCLRPKPDYRINKNHRTKNNYYIYFFVGSPSGLASF